MRKRTAAARSSCPGTRSCMTRAVSLLLCFVVAASMISRPSVARAGLTDAAEYGFDTLSKWLSGDSSQPLGGWTPVGYLDALFSSNKPQKYYTTPTSSVVDKSGNVTNYYRGGDTTNTQIIDSYNKTFNTIHNTTNNTNNYEANVKLSDFLNRATRSRTNTILQGVKLCGRKDHMVVKAGGLQRQTKATTYTLKSGMMG